MNRSIMFSKFIKYDVLDALLSSTPSSAILTKTPVDIYVDIRSVYRQIFSEDLFVNDIKVLSINILNLVAHYRHYFKSRFGIDTTIYIINGYVNNTNKRTGINNIIAEVNNTNENMFTLMDRLSHYFPLLYFVDKPNYNSSAIILSLAQQESVPRGHSILVVSNDIYSYQIPAYCINAFVLRPSTKPKLITMYNTIDYMFPRKRVSTSDLNPGLLPVIMGHHKCEELELPMINNFKASIEIIRELMRKNRIVNGYNPPSIFSSINLQLSMRIRECDLVTKLSEYQNSYDAIVNNSWKIRKNCDKNVLANILDQTFNNDQDNLLNYLFLLDVDDNFAIQNQ